ncbi:MAG: restriction endonuclease subunit S, partial [Conexivisphaera sp.]
VIANTEQSKDGSLIGSPAIVHFPEWYKKGKAVYSHHISKLNFRVHNLDANFLFYYFSFAQPLARKYHTGTGVWGLNVESWAKDLLIPIPHLSEQQRIASILSTIDKKLEVMRAERSRLERLKRGFMDELLTGRIRVRVRS